MKYPWLGLSLIITAVVTLNFGIPDSRWTKRVPAAEQVSFAEVARNASLQATLLVDELGPERIPDARVMHLQRLIALEYTKNSYFTGEIRELLEPRLSALLDDLKKAGKIRYLTADARSKLGVNSPEIRAFYIPLTGHVFLQKGLPELLAAKSLFHELFHAYQYVYRFPLDAKALLDESARGILSRSDLLEFLDFYYESQANFQTMKYSPEISWSPFFVRKSSLKIPPPLGYTGASLAVVGVALGVVGVVGTENALINRLLPKVDRQFGIRDWQGGKGTALHLSELVLLKDSDTTGYFASNIDLDFHKIYGKAVEHAYFGKDLSFLFKDNRDDLRIFNLLHDQYYERVGQNATVDRDPECRNLLAKIRAQGTAPLVAWLTLTSREIEACPAYQGNADDSYRGEFAELLLKGVKIGSPFAIGRRDEGTGTRPDAVVQPDLAIQPQLQVDPEEAP